MNNTETVVSTEEKFSGKMLRLRIDTVRLADGREAKREIVERNGSACVVAFLDDGSVLLVRQFRVAAGKELLEIPAGTIDEGELPVTCAVRELREETGYTAREIKPLFGYYASPGYTTERIYGFLATGLTSGKTDLDADEHVEVTSVPYDEIAAMIGSGAIEDGKTVAALLAAGPLIRERATNADLTV